ncbi:MAG: GxxExxY protein [Patescibacteria group bacterium]|nr:GxxExxY protein [Patescibacteria group bacterium]
MGWNKKESVYQRALNNELTVANLAFKSQFPVRSVTKEIYYLDLVVEDLLGLELKASRQFFSSQYLDQVENYLRETNLPLALILNFRNIRLKPIRVINPSLMDADYSLADAKFG